MLRQIVVGVDGSKLSFEAFDQALDIAKKIHSTIKAVFVIDVRKTQVPYIYAGGSYELSYERIYIPPDKNLQEFYEKIQNDLRAFAENCLKQCVEKGKEGSIEVSTEIVEGFPAAELCEESRSGDLLVIGQQGENAHFKRSVIGSTTEDLVRTSPRPILVVPSKREKIEKVLFPYDGSRTSEAALLFYANTLKGLSTNFVMLCVGDGEEGDHCVQEEEDYIKQHGLPLKIEKRDGHPTQIVTEMVGEENFDMILVGSHGRNTIKDYLLGSTTSNLIRNSSIPILVVY